MADPREIMPVEVWHIVASKVADWSSSSSSSSSSSLDAISFSRTCSVFQSLIDSSCNLPMALFSAVLEQVTPYLSTGDLLRCRLVCRGWKRAVDRAADSDPRLQWMQPSFKRLARITSFLENMSNRNSFMSTTNPFISTCVKFDDSGLRDGEVAEFWRLATGVCEKFASGNSNTIRKLTLNVSFVREEYDLCAMFRQLAAVLGNLSSSLRSLKISMDFDFEDDPNWPAHLERLLQAEEEEPGASVAAENVVSKLKHLALEGVPAELMRRTLKLVRPTLPLVVDLHSFAIDENAQRELEVLVEGMEGLSGLKVCPEILPATVASLLRHQNLEMSLRELYVNVRVDEWEVIPSLITDLNFFRQLRTLLLQLSFHERVVAHTGRLYENGDGRLPSLALDHLTSLSVCLTTTTIMTERDREILRSFWGRMRRFQSLRNRQCLSGFDFASHLPALEEFRLDVHRLGRISLSETRRERVKVAGFAGRMEWSNVWTMFRKLKTFVVVDGDGSRVGTGENIQHTYTRRTQVVE